MKVIERVLFVTFVMFTTVMGAIKPAAWLGVADAAAHLVQAGCQGARQVAPHVDSGSLTAPP